MKPRSILTIVLISLIVLQSVYGQTLKLVGQNYQINDVEFMPNEDGILIASDNWVKYWDLKSNRIQAYPHAFTVNDIAISPDGRTFLSASTDNLVRLWDINKSYKPLLVLEGHSWDKPFTELHDTGVNSVSFSNDGSYIISGGQDMTAKIWDANGQLILSHSLHDEGVAQVLFGPNQEPILIGTFGSHNYLNFEGKSTKLKQAKLSANGKFIALAWRPHVGLHQLDFSNLYAPQSGTSGGVSIYYPDGESMVDIQKGDPSALAIAPNDQLIAVGETDGTISIWSITGTLVKQYKTNNAEITSISFDSNSDRFITTDKNGRIRLWSIADGNWLAELYPSFGNDRDFAILLSSGYYYNSGRTIKGFIIDDQSYNLKSSDIKYHRPDLVLSELGYSSPKSIQEFYDAYRKRIEKQNINSKKLADDLPVLPEMNLDRSKMPRFSKEKEVILSVTGVYNYDLKSVHVSVNGVPIFGLSGYSVSGTELNEEIPVRLNQGRNKISLELEAVNGARSLPQEMLCVYQSEKTLPNLYFVGIGSGQFKQDSQLEPFHAALDATVLSQALQQKEGKLYQQVLINTLADRQVSKEEIRNLGTWLSNATEDDVVIIMYTGHGILDRESEEYYLSTYSFDMNQMDRTSLRIEDLELLIAQNPSRKKALFINACNSGEYDKDIEAFQRMKKVFVDLRANTGAYVISSSSSLEYSYTGQSEDEPTLFVEAMLELFEESDQINISDLVDELYIDEQRPTIRQMNHELDFRIW